MAYAWTRCVGRQQRRYSWSVMIRCRPCRRMGRSSRAVEAQVRWPVSSKVANPRSGLRAAKSNDPASQAVLLPPRGYAADRPQRRSWSRTSDDCASPIRRHRASWVPLNLCPALRHYSVFKPPIPGLLPYGGGHAGTTRDRIAEVPASPNLAVVGGPLCVPVTYVPGGTGPSYHHPR